MPVSVHNSSVTASPWGVNMWCEKWVIFLHKQVFSAFVHGATIHTLPLLSPGGSIPWCGLCTITAALQEMDSSHLRGCHFPSIHLHHCREGYSIAYLWQNDKFKNSLPDKNTPSSISPAVMGHSRNRGSWLQTKSCLPYLHKHCSQLNLDQKLGI